MLREGSVVFDIGAHVGFYTLLASQCVGPYGRVFAFEPFPANLRFLNEHLRLNRVSNVSVIEAAVSDAGGVACFEEGRTTSTGRLSEGGRIRVATVSLDEMVSSGQVLPPDFMKVDVEGAEGRVLRGGKTVISSARPVIFLATHNEAVHRECCDLLRTLGYAFHSLDAKPVGETREVLATWKA
jgi:FkbM family methyltransferase